VANFLNLDGVALNKNQGKWKRAAEAVAREVLRPNAERVDREAAFPRENIKALADAGLLGLLVDKEYGGPGESTVTAVVVTEAIAKGCAATAMAYHMHQTTIPVMCAMASADQVDPYIAPIARNEWLGAFAMSEPGSGNKIWHMDSFAEPANGDGFVIDSFKSFCTSSGYADYYLVPVRSERGASPNDMNLFFIKGDDPNIKCIGEWDGMGLRGNSSRPVHFDHCQVLGSQRIGKPKEGFGFMMAYALPIYLCGMAAVYIGVAQAAYEAAVEHVKKRIHTDTNRSLAHLETVQRLVAEMRIAIDTVRFTTLRIAQHADNAMVLFNEFKQSGLLDEVIRDNPDDPFFIEVSSLKPAACEMVINVTNKALQVCGGVGYKRGHTVERCYRDGRAGSVMGPSDDTVKLVIGTQILGLDQPWT
jgi:alkylation response protein AidB-like acyl-CoA dehydrogenase